LFSTILTIFSANCLGLIGFSKCWFNAIFGIKKKNFVYIQNDLSKKEIFVSVSSFSMLFFFSFFSNFIF
jgi:hypothetical protein